MNEDLVRDLRDDADWAEKSPDFTVPTILLYEMRKAADAIEELSREYESIAKSLNESVELVRKLQSSRWIPVTERLPESFGDDVLVTDGEDYAVGFWREDAKAWDSADFGWLENRSEPPFGIHTVTHWMPMPEPPEPPKEKREDADS